MMRRTFIAVLILAALCIIGSLTLLAGITYTYEKYRIRKIDFVKQSAENDPDSPFTPQQIEVYLKGMNLRPVKKNQAYQVEYDGFFFDKKWTIRPCHPEKNPAQNQTHRPVKSD